MNPVGHVASGSARNEDDAAPYTPIFKPMSPEPSSELPTEAEFQVLDRRFAETFERIGEIEPVERLRYIQYVLRSSDTRISQLLEARWIAIRELRQAGASYEDIAALLGVSKSRAQQLARRATQDGPSQPGPRSRP